jgi:protein TorT
MRRCLAPIILVISGLWASTVLADQGVWRLEARQVPFDDTSAATGIDYLPLDQAQQPWRLCVLYPHLKDAYWLSVNFGMREEAVRLGVGFDVFEAGGYPNVARQLDQLKECESDDFDAVILGTVSYDQLTPEVARIAREKPVIAAVNDIDDHGIAAKASVPWYEMGAAAGRFIAERHPAGSQNVTVAWFPGPEGAGWVSFVEAGFRDAIAGSAAQIIATRFGDTGLEQQVLLVEDVLDEFPDVDYLVGSGPMAEAGVSLLRARDLTDKVQIVSTYLSHGVFRGLMRGRILAAPTDSPVMQGRLAVEMAVRAIEGKLAIRHAGPKIEVLVPESLGGFQIEDSLAPASFISVFSLEARPSAGQ